MRSSISRPLNRALLWMIRLAASLYVRDAHTVEHFLNLFLMPIAHARDRMRMGVGDV